jgi:hypothetical protein
MPSVAEVLGYDYDHEAIFLALLGQTKPDLARQLLERTNLSVRNRVYGLQKILEEAEKCALSEAS